MNILTEIYRSENVNIHGKAIFRIAVRGVALRGRDLLMVHSTEVGDYKFPGGGVDEGETHEQTLRREIREECGLSLIHFGEAVGAVIEYGRPAEPDYDVFKMTSYYYLCEVDNVFGAQSLEAYERDLGFKPVWIDLDETIRANKLLLARKNKPGWLRRENFVLEYLRDCFSTIF